MRTRVLVASAVAVLGALAAPLAPASAQTGRLWHIGFGGGVTVPAGDLKDAFKSGEHGQAFLGYGLPGSAFSGRLGIDYRHFKLKPGPAANPVPAGTDNGTSRVFAGLANLTYGLPLGIVRPYLTAGAGVYDLGTSPAGGTSVSKTHFGINGGAGVQVRLGALQGFVEGRYENLYTDQGLDSGATSAKNFAAHLVPITFGLMY